MEVLNSRSVQKVLSCSRSWVIEKITVWYDSESKEHRLELEFLLPIVGDGIVWKNLKRKSEGYKLKKGKDITTVRIKKKILYRGRKNSPPTKPFRYGGIN